MPSPYWIENTRSGSQSRLPAFNSTPWTRLLSCAENSESSYTTAMTGRSSAAAMKSSQHSTRLSPPSGAVMGGSGGGGSYRLNPSDMDRLRDDARERLTRSRL